MRQVISRFSPFGMTNHYTFVLDKIDAIKATVTTAAAATVSTTLPLALSSGIGKISPWISFYIGRRRDHPQQKKKGAVTVISCFDLDTCFFSVMPSELFDYTKKL